MDPHAPRASGPSYSYSTSTTDITPPAQFYESSNYYASYESKPSHSSVDDITAPMQLYQIDDNHTPSEAYTTTIGEYRSRSDGNNVACTACLQRFGNSNARDRHYRTVHSNKGERPYTCDREGCPADVRSWTTAGKLRAHNKNWHGPYPCLEMGCPRGSPHGFASQGELDEHQRFEHGSPEILPSSSPGYSFEPMSASEPLDKGKAVQSDDATGPDDAGNTIISDMAQTSHLLPSTVDTYTSKLEDKMYQILSYSF